MQSYRVDINLNSIHIKIFNSVLMKGVWLKNTSSKPLRFNNKFHFIESTGTLNKSNVRCKSYRVDINLDSIHIKTFEIRIIKPRIKVYWEGDAGKKECVAGKEAGCGRKGKG